MRACLLLLAGFLNPLVALAGPAVADLGVTVTQNREYSFTDKESAYWYGRTNAPGTDWFSGWNIATERIFQDYRLTVGGAPADRASATVTVYPHRIVRRYAWGEESFEMADHERVLCIGVKAGAEARFGIALAGDRLRDGRVDGRLLTYAVEGLPGRVVAVSTLNPAAAVTGGPADGLLAGADAGGFLIVFGNSASDAAALLARAQREHGAWGKARVARMDALLARNVFRTGDATVDAALAWNLLSLDALVTRQSGTGIYAGLPWFNDYWGRDLFISLPGTCLVTGQLDTAREILRSFAKYQNTDGKSRDYGRVPNRLRPDDIIYNTTDGTPRFVIALRDYVRYSGDAALARELYPAVKRAMDGSLRHWVDAQGYLTHDDADTWMDARWESRIPWSPRGNRANDIQALWLQQLQAGAEFARSAGDEGSARAWTGVAARLQAGFTRNFLRPDGSAMADHVRADGTPDFTLRPNELFALDFVASPEARARLTRRAWETLVFPWGVASLTPAAADFHPWHENPTYLHKDEAYHNGTVWLWNNGIAIDRMLEAGATDAAYALFRNMARQSMDSRGAVGALSELTDALPRPGQAWANPSGTFSQAWSSAEFLRVWYQSFLGIRPDFGRGVVMLAPRLPSALAHVDFKVPLAPGALRGSLAREAGGAVRCRYALAAAGVTFALKLPGFAPVEVAMQPGEELVAVTAGGKLRVEVGVPGAKPRVTLDGRPDADEVVLAARLAEIMRGVDFARPQLDPALECLQPGHAARLKARLDRELAGAR